MLDNLVTYVPTALALLGAVIGVFAVVAPLTKTKRDDEALAFLQSCMNFLGRLVGAQVVKK
jgi:hypothetical protein